LYIWLKLNSFIPIIGICCWSEQPSFYTILSLSHFSKSKISIYLLIYQQIVRSIQAFLVFLGMVTHDPNTIMVQTSKTLRYGICLAPLLYAERTIANYGCHLFWTISRIGSCIPILSKMEKNMIQIILILTNIVILVMNSMVHTSQL
jgi:hypothetical protein